MTRADDLIIERPRFADMSDKECAAYIHQYVQMPWTTASLSNALRGSEDEVEAYLMRSNSKLLGEWKEKKTQNTDLTALLAAAKPKPPTHDHATDENRMPHEPRGNEAVRVAVSSPRMPVGIRKQFTKAKKPEIETREATTAQSVEPATVSEVVIGNTSASSFSVSEEELRYDGGLWSDLTTLEKIEHIRTGNALDISFGQMATLMNAISPLTGKVSRNIVIGFVTSHPELKKGNSVRRTVPAGHEQASRRTKSSVETQPTSTSAVTLTQSVNGTTPSTGTRRRVAAHVEPSSLFAPPTDDEVNAESARQIAAAIAQMERDERAAQRTAERAAKDGLVKKS